MNPVRSKLHRPARLSVLLAALLASAPAPAQLALASTGESPRSLAAVRFRFVADGPVRGGFAEAGGKLLFGTETGSIYALDANDGRVVWRKTIGSPLLSTPATAGGSAYFTSWDNMLHALDVGSGRERWRRDLGRSTASGDYWEYYVASPILAGNRLLIGSASGSFSSIDAASGRIMWTRNVGARIRTTAAVAGDIVVFGTMSGHVVALDSRDGHPLWDFATEGAAHDFSFKDNDTRSVVTAPIVEGDLVIAGGRDGNLYGIDLRTGRERWRETHDGGSWILGLASDRDRIYSGSGSAFIMQAADARTGKEIWRTATANAMFGGLAKAGGVLVSNGNKGNLFGFDARSGTQLWRFRLSDMALSSPLVAPGVVYTGADDGSVYAIETRADAAPKFERLIYSFADQPAPGFFWFTREMLQAIRGNFLTAGYAAMANAGLRDALATPMGEQGRKIIVLADTRLPDGVDGAMLRRFLDGGGTLVLIGPNPVNFTFDESGAPAGEDADKQVAAFGVAPPDRQRDFGYNVSSYTPPAQRLGLGGHSVANGWARPDQVSMVLATDRSGMATAWAKQFGNRGLLIEMPIPRYRAVDLNAEIDAIDLIAAKSAAGGP